jgi:hypothetical protein
MHGVSWISNSALHLVIIVMCWMVTMGFNLEVCQVRRNFPRWVNTQADLRLICYWTNIKCMYISSSISTINWEFKIYAQKTFVCAGIQTFRVQFHRRAQPTQPQRLPIEKLCSPLLKMFMVWNDRFFGTVFWKKHFLCQPNITLNIFYTAFCVYPVLRLSRYISSF